VALAKARDRRVIGHLIGRDHPNRDILHTARSMPRDERCPREYAYTNNATIIAGSCAARP